MVHKKKKKKKAEWFDKNVETQLNWPNNNNTKSIRRAPTGYNIIKIVSLCII